MRVWTAEYCIIQATALTEAVALLVCLQKAQVVVPALLQRATANRTSLLVLLSLTILLGWESQHVQHCLQRLCLLPADQLSPCSFSLWVVAAAEVGLEGGAVRARVQVVHNSLAWREEVVAVRK